MLDSGYRMPAPEGTPDEMYKLMLKCWNYEAEARPHFKEIHSKIDILFSRYVFELGFHMQQLRYSALQNKPTFWGFSYKMPIHARVEKYKNVMLNPPIFPQLLTLLWEASP